MGELVPLQESRAVRLEVPRGTWTQSQATLALADVRTGNRSRCVSRQRLHEAGGRGVAVAATAEQYLAPGVVTVRRRLPYRQGSVVDSALGWMERHRDFASFPVQERH